VRDEHRIGRRRRRRALGEGVELVGILKFPALFEHQREEVEAFNRLH